MKMNELYTARYSDGRTVYEKPLDWIYANQGAASVEISPAIWLWKSSHSPIYFVDYVGEGIGCTLSTFDSLTAAREYREQIGEMTTEDFESWLVNVRWKQ